VNLIMEALPLIRQRDCAGVPVEQANTQLLFEAGNSAADTRGCDAEQPSGPPKTARIDNSHKRYDAAQEAR
jgi:hypothetical protein